MGGASRLLLLIPSPPLRPSALLSRRLTRTLTTPTTSLNHRPLRRLGFRIPSPAIPKANSADVTVFTPPRPWPEWKSLVDFLAGLSDNREAENGGEGELVGGEEMGEEFVRAVGDCIRFSRERPELLRLLDKEDVRILVENGSPRIFMNGEESARRLRSFLDGDELPSEQAGTVDIMQYLLSYVWLSLSTQEESYFQSREIIEATSRKLLSAIVNASHPTSETQTSEIMPSQTLSKHKQFSRPPGQNIEMKRGDWICAKCSFMNFAKNMRCLECNEARPKRILTGGEWECPQCDFFNYGRNTSCLRCDCRLPAKNLPSTAGSQDSSSYSRSSTIDQILNGSIVSKSENRLERRLSNQPGGSSLSSESISQSLDRIIGHTSASSRSNDPSSQERDAESGTTVDNSYSYTRRMEIQRRDPDYVPFVPLPPDMFSKPGNVVDKQSVKQENSVSARDDKQSELGFNRFEGITESKNAEGPSDTTERWSSKVADHDDDDFPEIMPMRKGENRFVISKKKDRSLTSPQYKRRMAMEQANNSNFVPFVPFPPDYFAKKDKESDHSSAAKSATEGTTASAADTGEAEKIKEFKVEDKSLRAVTNTSGLFGDYTTKQLNSETSKLNSPRRETNDSTIHDSYGRTAGNSSGLSNQSRNNQNQPWNRLRSQDSTYAARSAARTQQTEASASSSESWKTSFPGKSLEGSAVSEEPDPLDMSEEAKAQRWFRRVAQIKDISELADIPDEDFPEIMPMRKGVNRFVVSKRKTPLERRLTSLQYQKNLPIASPEQDKGLN